MSVAIAGVPGDTGGPGPSVARSTLRKIKIRQLTSREILKRAAKLIAGGVIWSTLENHSRFDDRNRCLAPYAVQKLLIFSMLFLSIETVFIPLS